MVCFIGYASLCTTILPYSMPWFSGKKTWQKAHETSEKNQNTIIGFNTFKLAS